MPGLESSTSHRRGLTHACGTSAQTSAGSWLCLETTPALWLTWDATPSPAGGRRGWGPLHPLLASLGRSWPFCFLFDGVLVLRVGVGSRPDSRVPFRCFANEKEPKERRPCYLRPCAFASGNLRCSPVGCAAELATRLVSASLRQLRRVRWTKHVRHGPHMPPHRLRASAQVEGSWRCISRRISE